MTVERIDRCDECNAAALRAFPNRLTTLAVILPSANPRVGAKERRRVTELSSQRRGTTLAAAQVIDGTGFWASTVRAVLTGMNMLSSTQQKVFEADADAVAWLARVGYVAASPVDALAVLREARRIYAEVRRSPARRASGGEGKARSSALKAAL